MIKLVEKYIHDSKYFPDSLEFNEYYLSHPDYPSLYAVTDTLNFFNIENIAATVPIDQFDNLPESFISLVQSDKGDQFVYVTGKKISVSYLDEDFKPQSLTKNQFITNWKQIILAIDENENPLENNITEPNKFKWNIIFLLALVLILFLNFTGNFYLPALIFSVLCLAGLFLSVLIMQESFGVSSEITSKICGVTQTDKGGCHTVLSSDEAKIYKNVTLSDICFVFFTTLSALTIFPVLQYFFIPISLISLPVIAYSVWSQKYKIKKWCPLCLAVCVILLGISIFSWFIFSFDQIVETIKSTALFLIILLLVSSIWFYTKPLVKGYFDLKNSDRQHKRFKRNFNTFNALLKTTQEFDTEELSSLQKIEIGNSGAFAELELFLSPSCGHCHKAFEDAYNLFQKFPEKIKLSIYFNVNVENEGNPYTKVAEIITQEYVFNSVEKAVQLLKEWHINNTTLEDFKKKNDINITDQTKSIILSHFNWCRNNDLNYTPIKIFNQKLLPDEYNIEDLKYFINEYEPIHAIV
jgi:hypothetical protein